MQIDNSWLQHKGTREEREAAATTMVGERRHRSKFPIPHLIQNARSEKTIASLVGGENVPKKKSSTIWAENFF